MRASPARSHTATDHRPRRFFADFMTTTATSIVTALALLYITHLFAVRHGQDGLGFYVMFRRIAAVLVPISTLMVGIGLTRAIAIQRPEIHAPTLAAALLGTLGTALTSAAVLVIPHITLLPPSFTITQSGLVGPTIVFLWAHLLYVLAFAIFRGNDQMRRANMLQIICVAAAPTVLVLALPAHGDPSLPTYAVAAAYAAAGAVSIPAVMRAAIHRPQSTTSQTAQLARYCLPRVPGNLGMTAILAAAPSFALLTHGISGAGMLGAAQTAFGVAEAGASALGLLLLPQVASLWAAHRIEEIRTSLSDVTILVTQASIPTALALAFYAPEIIQLWLGSGYEASVSLFRITCLGLTPYVLYVALRSAVDAVDERALNTISVVLALGAQLSLLALANRVSARLETYAVATTGAVIVLGTCTFYIVARRGLISIARHDLLFTISAALALIAPMALYESRQCPNTPALKVCLLLVACIAYCAIVLSPRSSRTRMLIRQATRR